MVPRGLSCRRATLPHHGHPDAGPGVSFIVKPTSLGQGTSPGHLLCQELGDHVGIAAAALPHQLAIAVPTTSPPPTSGRSAWPSNVLSATASW